MNSQKQVRTKIYRSIISDLYGGFQVSQDSLAVMLNPTVVFALVQEIGDSHL